MARTIKRDYLRQWSGWLIVAAVSPLMIGTVVFAPAQGQVSIEFNRDIRPILSENCFTCHGPDEGQRQVGMRLDTREGIFQDRGGYQPVVAGDPTSSRLYQRITAHDEEARMPPLWSKRKRLNPLQIRMIQRWIAQGAKWEMHWAFVKPQRPELPQVKKKDWPRNGIDYFVLDRLEQEGLSPLLQADRTTLIRRLTLDLTGLPPTPKEVKAFLSDNSPSAYEEVVDRLLASSRFGERMAWRWLEAARYADTNGYQTDAERYMWRWRDWVIDAFNRNMPFDQFTVEQIAGDMLPNPSLDQKIATGFNRNHRGNGEGGLIPEEYAVEYVVDRVETTSTVWLGLTMGCARCHNHKYDPIRRKEFYQVFAYFNNVPENGRANKYGNSPPMIKAPTPPQQRKWKELDDEVAAAERRFDAMRPDLAAAQADWEALLGQDKRIDWVPSRDLQVYYPLDGDLRLRGSAAENIDSGSDSIGSHDSKFQGQARFVVGRLGEAADLGRHGFIEAGDMAGFGFYDRFSMGAWIYPHETVEGTVLSRMEDSSEAKGYSLYLKDGKVQLNLNVRRLDDSLRVETVQSLAAGKWHHLMATYDGGRMASGVKIYVNGRPMKLKILIDELNQSFDSNQPFRIGAVEDGQGRFHGLVDEVRVYSRVLDPKEAGIIATPEFISEIVALAPSLRREHQAAKIDAYFLEHHSPKPVRTAWRDWLAVRGERDDFVESVPTTMVMEEMDTPRQTYALNRGEYDKPGEKVAPAIPAIFPPLPRGEENNRLGFARWLVDPSNPLTARVTVNRSWQMYFGTGLVKSAENFGSQGDPPSHPKLMDWLATEFMDSVWDMKALQKTIVMSASYRQSSKTTPQLLKRDPENRLLARGPRLRLSAEMIRDQALAASGLLVEKLGGPSVRPYQPKGLWTELQGGPGYTPDTGENLYRRSLYTYWKRTIPPPNMASFDAADRESCAVLETRTNTPLQALGLMNGVTYVEAARVLAERVMKDGGETPQARISRAFQLAIARPPRDSEMQVLIDGFNQHLGQYRAHPESARELVSVGEYPRNQALDVSELAAYTAVSSLILNLDETITKE